MTNPTFTDIEAARRRWTTAGRVVTRRAIDINEVNPDDPFGEPCWRIEGLDDMLSTRDLVALSPPAMTPPTHPADRPQRINAQTFMSKSDLYASKISLAEIRLDGGTQPRVAMDPTAINDYAEAIKAGDKLPPITVFDDGHNNLWLADGFHRYAAAKAAGHDSIWADIKKGTQRDAVIYAVGANITHGLRRTSADKRRAIERLLLDPEWRQWSDAEIARRVVVDPKTVAAVRADISLTFNVTEPTKRLGADGRVINITNIGNRPTAAPTPTMEIPESDGLRDATPADLRALLEHISTTADVLNMDRQWLRDYLISAGKQKALRIYISQAAEAIQAYINDQLAQTIHEIAPTPEPERLPIWKIETLVSDWAKKLVPDVARRHPVLFGIKTSRERSEHWQALVDALDDWRHDVPYNQGDLHQALNNVYDRLDQELRARAIKLHAAQATAVQVEHADLVERTRLETIEPAANLLAAEIAALNPAAWAIVYETQYGQLPAPDSDAQQIITTLAANWMRGRISPVNHPAPPEARDELTTYLVTRGVPPPWLDTDARKRFALHDVQLNRLERWLDKSGRHWAGQGIGEKLAEANKLADAIADIGGDGADARQQRVQGLHHRLTDLQQACQALADAGINQYAWAKEIFRLLNSGDDVAAAGQTISTPVLQYAAAALPAGVQRNAVLAVLHDRLGGKP